MPEFNAVENTLFIPMLGRIYASEHFQNILYDEKALSLKDVLPKGLAETGSQSQYTLLASASRSANMDRYIRDFLRRKPDGVIAELGCGLETTFYRNDDGHTRWYAVDLPDVMEYRKTLLPEPERQTYFAGDAFSDGWIRQIRIDAPDAPVLVTAGGLFHYFEEEKSACPSADAAKLRKYGASIRQREQKRNGYDAEEIHEADGPCRCEDVFSMWILRRSLPGKLAVMPAPLRRSPITGISTGPG